MDEIVGQAEQQKSEAAEKMIEGQAEQQDVIIITTGADVQDETGADNTISTTTCSAEHVTHNIRQCHTTTWPVARYVELPSINKHKHIVTQNNNLGTTPRDDQDQAEHNSQVKGQAEQCRAWDDGDEGQTDSQNEAVEDRSQAEQYQPSKKMGQAEQKTIAEGMGGPCHLYGGGRPLNK